MAVRFQCEMFGPSAGEMLKHIQKEHLWSEYSNIVILFMQFAVFCHLISFQSLNLATENVHESFKAFKYWS